MNVIHAFLDVNMGKSFPGLHALLAEKRVSSLKEGDCALFMNAKWTAVKVVYPDMTMLYWRKPERQVITYDELRGLPARIAAELKFKEGAQRQLVRGPVAE